VTGSYGHGSETSGSIKDEGFLVLLASQGGFCSIDLVTKQEVTSKRTA
jgi:hypothetical protein